jgi:hypothetical protein
MPCDPWTGLVAQLDAATAPPAAATRPHYNPCPKGTIQQGSATEAVLVYLRSVRDGGRWLERAQIVLATGRTEKSIDWALLFLRSQGLIETAPDGRRAHYLLYRARITA